MQTKQLSRNNEKIIIIIVIVLIFTTNFFSGLYFREPMDGVIYRGDDATHIALINSFSDKQDFLFDFFTERKIFYSAHELIEKYPVIETPLIIKGPIYYMFVGTIFNILDVSVENDFNVASYVNNFLVPIFLILLFFFVKKHFGLKIALLTVSIAITIPYLAFNTARIFLYPLFFIFSISAFYFIKQKSSNYLLFGLFTGLAHLTHPFGIYLGAGYLFFLLLNREFKGFLQVLLVWHITLIPWFVRNYYVLNDIGRGLYLPFSKQFTLFLNNFFTNVSTFELGPRVPTSIIHPGDTFYQPFEVFSRMFEAVTNIYHMEILILFIIFFSGFTFISTKILKNNLKFTIFCFLELLGLYVLLFVISEPILQLLGLYVLPWAFIILLKKYKPEIFVNNIPRLHLIIISLTYVTCVGLFFYAIILQVKVPEIKQMLFFLILLIPLSLTGFGNFISVIFQNRKLNSKHTTLITVMVLTIIILSMLPGFSQLNINTERIPHETQDVKIVNDFVRNTIPSETMIATNDPYILSLKTDNPSIILPYSSTSQYDVKEYLNYYDIDYIVYYHFGEETQLKNSKSKQSDKIKKLENTLKKIESITIQTLKPVPEPVLESMSDKTIKSKGLPIASFVDKSVDPQNYVDIYKNDPNYKEWFDENFPEYYSIYNAVGLELPPEEKQKRKDEKMRREFELRHNLFLPYLEIIQQNDLTDQYFYEKVFSSGNSFVLKVQDISNVTIEHPYDYLRYGVILDTNDEHAKAEQIFNDLVDTGYISKSLNEILCLLSLESQVVDIIDYYCKKLLEEDDNNKLGHISLVASFSLRGDKDALMSELNFILSKLTLHPNPGFENLLLSSLDEYIDLTPLEEGVIESILEKELFSIPSEHSERILEKFSNYKNLSALPLIWKMSQQLDPNDLESSKMLRIDVVNRVSSGKLSLTDTQKNLLIDHLMEIAYLYEEENDLSEVEKTFVLILQIDHYNPVVAEKYGELLEKQERYVESFQQYRLAYAFGSNEKLNDKLDELEEIIISGKQP